MNTTAIPSPQPRWQHEIAGLHEFFAKWLGGALPNTDEAFERFEQVTDSEFKMVTPNGDLIDRATIVRRLRAAHGSRLGIEIWIENAELRHQEGNLWLATYEEWQRFDGRVSARISTVLLRHDRNVVGGICWLHVHETWMPYEPKPAQ